MIIYDASGVVLLDIEVDDTSLRYKAIKGENSLTLKFSLSEFVEFPLGSWCEFKGTRAGLAPTSKCHAGSGCLGLASWLHPLAPRAGHPELPAPPWP